MVHKVVRYLFIDIFNAAMRPIHIYVAFSVLFSLSVCVCVCVNKIPSLE